MKLRIQQVVKSFGDTLVLDGIDLDVEQSEVICLIGASGSGKSTLLRCINLLEPIDDGTILLDGDDISVETFWFPFVWLVWLGGFMAAGGGLVAWLVRRPTRIREIVAQEPADV